MSKTKRNSRKWIICYAIYAEKCSKFKFSVQPEKICATTFKLQFSEGRTCYDTN